MTVGNFHFLYGSEKIFNLESKVIRRCFPLYPFSFLFLVMLWMSVPPESVTLNFSFFNIVVNRFSFLLIYSHSL